MSFDDLVDIALDSAKQTIGGEVASFTFSNASTGSCKVISFENDHLEIDQNGMAVSTGKPMMDIKASDLNQYPKIDGTVAFRGIEYLITDVRPDGHGKITLILTKVEDA